MVRVLLVEDDPILNEGLAHAIRNLGYQVDGVKSVRDAMVSFRENPYDLLVLDIALPDGDGFEICRAVRQSSAVPIIFLTASDEEVSVVRGLDMGADDYVPKPFRLNEVLSRIRALIRRTSDFHPSEYELAANGIRLDILNNLAYKNEVPLSLTATELKLLALLMRHPNRVLSRETLLDKLWDHQGDFVDDNTLSVYISRLRGKIEDDPEHPKMLINLRGIGYQWIALMGE